MSQTKTPQQQLAGKKTKIMPGIGCLARRLYIEHYLAKVKPLELEPCISCSVRSQCKKTMVHF